MTFLKLLEKHWLKTSLITILVMAIGLRFYNLGQVPHGLTWDEAAIGYNGFAIWETHRDEWLKFMPISFQSFGDYKAPLAIYINAVFVGLLGLNPVAVRLPFALAGVMAIAGMGFLTWQAIQLWQERQKKLASKEVFAVVAMLIMVLSPWHIHFSRAGFESGLAMSLLVWAQGLIFFYVNYQRQNKLRFLSLVMAVGLMAASMYAYHSAKVVVPLLLLGNFAFLLKTWQRNFRTTLAVGVMFLVLLAPMAFDSFRGAGGDRLGQVSIFSGEASLPTKVIKLGSNMLEHFNLEFLIFGETQSLRQGDGKWGVLLPTTLLLVLSGLMLAFDKKTTFNKDKKLIAFIAWWIVVGFIPASLGTDEIPHANRALLGLPAFILLAVMGLKYWEDRILRSKLNSRVKGNHNEKNIVLKAAGGGLLLVHMILSLSHINHYFTVFAQQSADAFQSGYLEMFETIIPYEDGDETHEQVDKLVVTSDYGQPYIYALFARKTNPIWYRGGSLIKYEFKEVNVGDLVRDNAIVVAAGDDEMPTAQARHYIYGSDGSLRFQIFYTNEIE